MNILTALQNGQTVYFKSYESRYYEMVDGQIFYSDDLVEWLPSTIQLGQFANDCEWGVLEQQLKN